MKAADKFIDRRRHIRLKAPLSLSYNVIDAGEVRQTTTKDISADGLRFETHDKAFGENAVLEVKLGIPEAANAVHAKCRVVWKKKLSLEDRAPFDVGVEFIEIEEDNKNTFLKFLCDLIYSLPEGSKHAHKKI